MDQSSFIQLERFRGVVAIQQAIGDARGNLPTVMNAIVNEKSVMPQCNGIVVELRDGDQIYYAAASGTSSALLGLRLPLSSSLSGRCVLSGEPLWCSDAETDPRVNLEACRRVGLRSMIVIPIPHRGQTVGVLKYHAAEPGAFDENDMLMAHLLVGPIAVGMSNVGEEDALRSQTELQSLVEMKEQFVSNVSHELRTPLTSIAGSLNLLHQGVAGVLPDKAIPLVDIASRNADRLKRLVDDLLDVGGLSTGQVAMSLASVDLCDLVRNAVEQNRPFADRMGVTLEAITEPRAAICTTDGERLFQAITNLISNAAKFSPENSVVTVELRTSEDNALIRVIDQGPGIPVSFRQQLFDRFSQSGVSHGKSGTGGTGLGLSITKGIVERLGGRVRLDENYLTGAAFEISMPLAGDGSSAQ